MKFVLMMAETDHYEKWQRAGDAEREAVFAAFGAFAEAVAERGSIVAGEGLAPTTEAVTVRPGSGPERSATEGPYAESAEQVGGIWIVDLPDLATAVELARLLPASYAIEIRRATED